MSRQLIDYPTWVKRMEKYFIFIDKDRNGIITIDEIQQWASNMEGKCKARPGEMVRLRAELYTFWSKIGLERDVRMTKKDFINGVNRLGNAEVKRRMNADVTFLEKVSNAYFDIFDIDKDGKVTLEELKTVMSATNNKPEDAHAWLDNVKSNKKDGAVDREDIFHNEYNFWFNPSRINCDRCNKCIWQRN